MHPIENHKTGQTSSPMYDPLISITENIFSDISCETASTFDTNTNLINLIDLIDLNDTLPKSKTVHAVPEPVTSIPKTGFVPTDLNTVLTVAPTVSDSGLVTTVSNTVLDYCFTVPAKTTSLHTTIPTITTISNAVPDFTLTVPDKISSFHKTNPNENIALLTPTSSVNMPNPVNTYTQLSSKTTQAPSYQNYPSTSVTNTVPTNILSIAPFLVSNSSLDLSAPALMADIPKTVPDFTPVPHIPTSIVTIPETTPDVPAPVVTIPETNLETTPGVAAPVATIPKTTLGVSAPIITIPETTSDYTSPPFDTASVPDHTLPQPHPVTVDIALKISPDSNNSLLVPSDTAFMPAPPSITTSFHPPKFMLKRLEHFMVKRLIPAPKAMKASQTTSILATTQLMTPTTDPSALPSNHISITVESNDSSFAPPVTVTIASPPAHTLLLPHFTTGKKETFTKSVSQIGKNESEMSTLDLASESKKSNNSNTTKTQKTPAKKETDKEMIETDKEINVCQKQRFSTTKTKRNRNENYNSQFTTNKSSRITNNYLSDISSASESESDYHGAVKDFPNHAQNRFRNNYLSDISSVSESESDYQGPVKDIPNRAQNSGYYGKHKNQNKKTDTEKKIIHKRRILRKKSSTKDGY